MNKITAFTFAALSLLALAAALDAAQSSKPNILLIVSEDTGPELGCYGDRFARTPNLDRLAGGGIRFDHAFVPYSICLPSRTAFLTGLYPHQNGQIGLATHKFAMYRQDTPNIATLLKPADYRTGLIGKLHVNPESAFPFDFRAIPSSNFGRTVDGEKYAEEAAKFWAEFGSKPWFLSVNFPDTHLPFIRQVNNRPAKPQTGADVKMLPWIAVESERLRDVQADYYNCLARLDEWVGLLLAALNKSGAADNTLIVYLGDHGPQFPRGKGTVYEGALRVPLILHWPQKAQAGLARSDLVSTIDLLPTMLKAAGIDKPKALPGLSLLPLLKAGTAPAWRRYIYGLTTGAAPRMCFVQHSIRDDRYKLISSPRPGTENLDAGTYLDPAHPHYVVTGLLPTERAVAPPEVKRALERWEHPPRFELYDLKNDPHEWNNLAEDRGYAAVKKRLVKALDTFQRQTADPFRDQKNVDAFVEQQLSNRDLRYEKDKEFCWDYLKTFPVWRDLRQ